MRLPSKDLLLAGGLTCPAQVTQRGAWIAHVIKHPLGLNATVRSGAKDPWNNEGWDQLTPPVVATGERASLVKDIASLDVDGARCAVPEFRGGPGTSNLDRPSCYACPDTLAGQCAWILDGPSTAYADVIRAMIEGFAAEKAVEVRREDFSRRLMRAVARREPWSTVSVLTVGLDDRSQSSLIARISRADGVRVELYVRGTALSWRTAWRRPPAHANAATSFLLDHARPFKGAPLSDLCLVDRHWWEHLQERSS